MNKLVTITNSDIKSILKGHSDITLLYPLKDYCVGYDLTFDIDVIDDYLLINRLLNDEELDNLEIILKKSNIKGIVFDDLGIIDIIKGYSFEKILLLDHLACNSTSINYYLDYVDSVIVSNDLTKDEILNIVKNAKKKLVVNVFGLKTLMYSRRNLITNYEKYHNLELKDRLDLKIEDAKFKAIENKYGTKFYAYPYYNALELLNLDNILYFWYDPIFLNTDDIIKVVLNNDVTNIDVSPIFLDKKTYYKVGDKNA